MILTKSVLIYITPGNYNYYHKYYSNKGYNIEKEKNLEVLIKDVPQKKIIILNKNKKIL
jgi:hypothetical protein